MPGPDQADQGKTKDQDPAKINDQIPGIKGIQLIKYSRDLGNDRIHIYSSLLDRAFARSRKINF